ncbi:MAG: type II secretion system protein GspK [Planctomycetes bacterium]|nr:type II secretion system protein GspK [Planctomycetota bacterium]
MRTLRRPSPSRQRGAALLLSVLVLFVVITISIQIGIGTMTDARVARNDLGLAAMDDAIESAMLEVTEQLKSDMGGGEEGAGADLGGDGGGDPMAAIEAAEGGGESGAVDSKEDEWARPQRTEINGLELRIFVQDEDSKYNVLNMLTPDEQAGEDNMARVARIIDLAREGTELDINTSDAETMAREMREHMLRRFSTASDEAEFLSTDPESDRRMPLSLREFERLESFEEHHFRDFRDEMGGIVHSLGSFLTVWSCLTDQESSGTSATSAAATVANGLAGELQGQSGAAANDFAGAVGKDDTIEGLGTIEGDSGLGVQDQGPQTESGEQGGGALAGADPTDGFGVNINTAPPAVLKGIFDDRDISSRFWDEVIEYRNTEEEVELEPGAEEPEPVYDEYGNEVIQRQVFDTLEELGELRGWEDMPAEEQELIRAYSTTSSNVFSVFITARRSTSNSEEIFIANSAAEREREEELAAGLVRTVRAVVWRREGGEEGATLQPVVRWEVLDYSPYEVQDFPEEDR